MSDTFPPAGDTPLTFRDFQDHIRRRYFDTDSKRGTAGTFMWLVEEVGELATALHKSAGEGGDTSGDDDPAGEFADVLAWLCTLARYSTPVVRPSCFQVTAMVAALVAGPAMRKASTAPGDAPAASSPRPIGIDPVAQT